MFFCHTITFGLIVTSEFDATSTNHVLLIPQSWYQTFVLDLHGTCAAFYFMCKLPTQTTARYLVVFYTNQGFFHILSESI